MFDSNIVYYTSISEEYKQTSFFIIVIIYMWASKLFEMLKQTQSQFTAAIASLNNQEKHSICAAEMQEPHRFAYKINQELLLWSRLYARYSY